MSVCVRRGVERRTGVCLGLEGEEIWGYCFVTSQVLIAQPLNVTFNVKVNVN